MKNIFKTIAVFATVSILFTGCKKDDVAAPTITVASGNALTVSLNAPFVNPTATATDEKDGDLSSSISVSGTVNKDLAGDYTLTYTVSDAAGNQASQDVIVTVRNDAYAWARTYAVTDTCGASYFSYAQIVTVDAVINNKVHFNKFADYSGNTGIYANVLGSSITVPSQTAVGIGSLVESHTFSGTGATTTTGFYIFYTDVNNTATATASCRAWFN
jgi:Domain of unknown function (DUF5011)